MGLPLHSSQGWLNYAEHKPLLSKHMTKLIYAYGKSPISSQSHF